jgi:hypothetical protein
MAMTRRGPNTQRGKAASSRNAVTHGLTSASPVIPGESEEDWQRHLKRIIDSLQPGNYLEEQLAALIALGLWRRWRIERYEVEVVTNNMDHTQEDLEMAQAYAERTLSKGVIPEIPQAQVEAARRRRALPPDADLDKIMRYKNSELRQLLQHMHEFEALQARRKGERTSLARFDFTASPLP